MASLDDAVEHYKSQVPELIFLFARELSDLRARAEKEGDIFTHRYPSAIFRLAEEEVRKRMRIASESLRLAMDAGWLADERNLSSDYTKCFALTDYRTDSFADINVAINSATTGIGQDNPELESKYKRLIGEIQVAASRQAIASLRMYARRKESERFPVGHRAPSDESSKEVDLADATPSAAVFITHGRDEASRDAVRAFVYELGLTPIVLEDQANAGMTIIEKYEKYADVGYGIAILSPDDVGCLSGDAPGHLKPRARQNVIFELGYMFAKIRRHRVAVCLTDSSLEKPTNIEGIVWVPLDANGGWKHKLRKELREAGLPVRG